MPSSRAQGERNRTVGVTNLNERSSRSHAILTLWLESRPVDASMGQPATLSKLHLVCEHNGRSLCGPDGGERRLTSRATSASAPPPKVGFAARAFGPSPDAAFAQATS
jgi:hypothetical protein